MTILQRMSESHQCGLEAWRQVAYECGKLGWNELAQRQKWLLGPPACREYALIPEAIRAFEHQHDLLVAADREDAFEVNEQSRRSSIINHIIGQRPEMKGLYEHIKDPKVRKLPYKEFITEINLYRSNYETSPSGRGPTLNNAEVPQQDQTQSSPWDGMHGGGVSNEIWLNHVGPG